MLTGSSNSHSCAVRFAAVLRYHTKFTLTGHRHLHALKHSVQVRILDILGHCFLVAFLFKEMTISGKREKCNIQSSSIVQFCACAIASLFVVPRCQSVFGIKRHLREKTRSCSGCYTILC